MSRIAFLGLGAMGRPMAGRLLDVGHETHVWNRTPGRDEDLVARGAVRAATPADAVRGTEVAITMLADPPALEQVLFGPDGAAEGLTPSSTLIDMSTVGPTAIRAAAARLQPVAVLDAPVLGSVPHAEGGTLTILVGGDPEVVEAHAELLAVLGKVFRAGSSGAGAALKLAANASSISALVGLGEMLALTDRIGLDPEVVLDGIGAGPLGSLIERWRGRITRPAEDSHFRLALARKDLALVLEEAERAGIRLDVPSAAAGRFEEAVGAGLGDSDFSAIVGVVRS
jgi:3-hydroxyisobutyrate dehydrogenase-like beta-hydroxyacid dehydrogenase